MQKQRPQPYPGDKFTFLTATAVIISNMVGTGVFTSLGFQLLEFESGFLLIALWVAGGLAAFCGAMSYAELGAALPRSGGEYNFLSEIYHPAAGFVSGWISATIGFAAPRIAGNRVEGKLSTNVIYALVVEHGSRPHWPPRAPIEFWVARKLGVRGKRVRAVAFLVARKIARRGTPAQRNEERRAGTSAAHA
mgnify:CR=1 FL=1